MEFTMVLLKELYMYLYTLYTIIEDFLAFHLVIILTNILCT